MIGSATLSGALTPDIERIARRSLAYSSEPWKAISEAVKP